MSNGHPDRGGLIARLGRVVGAVEDFLIAILLTGMILLAGSQILLRDIWQMALSWGDPLLRVSVLWIGLLGAMAATRDDKHIRINVLQRLVPPWLASVSRAVSDLVSAAICGTVSYYAVLFVLMDRDAGSRAFAGIQSWVCELIIPIGFGVMALRFLLFLLQHLTGTTPPAEDRTQSP